MTTASLTAIVADDELEHGTSPGVIFVTAYDQRVR